MPKYHFSNGSITSEDGVYDASKHRNDDVPVILILPLKLNNQSSSKAGSKTQKDQNNA